MKSPLMRAVFAGLIALAAFGNPARAEDERGRWSFSFGLGAHSTFDDIRNNATQVITRENNLNRPPDGEISNDQVIGFDPRPDDLLARSAKVEEKQRFDFSVSYGLTSWLSLQFDTGLYRGDVAPLDVFTAVERWSQPEGTVSPVSLIHVTEGISGPLTVGQLTQIPVAVNAVVRFRKDSPFNPFLGVGVGYMFNDLKENGSLETLNNQILRGFNRVIDVPLSEGTGDGLINLQQIYDGFLALENSGGDVSPVLVYDVDCTEVGDGTSNLVNVCTALDDPSRLASLPTQPFIQAEVDDAFLYQFSLGADYHFNERWSAFVAARYIVTDAKVTVKIRGTDPVRGAFSLDEATFRNLSEYNPAFGDLEGRFDRDELDAGNALTSRAETLHERTLVQGGEIDLTAFTIGAGIRFTF